MSDAQESFPLRQRIRFREVDDSDDKIVRVEESNDDTKEQGIDSLSESVSPNEDDKQDQQNHNDQNGQTDQHQKKDNYDNMYHPILNNTHPNRRRKLSRKLSSLGKFTIITEERTNLSIGTSLVLLEKSGLTNDELERILDEKWCDHYKMRSRVSSDLESFEQVEDFEVRNHIRYIDFKRTFIPSSSSNNLDAALYSSKFEESPFTPPFEGDEEESLAERENKQSRQQKTIQYKLMYRSEFEAQEYVDKHQESFSKKKHFNEDSKDLDERSSISSLSDMSENSSLALDSLSTEFDQKTTYQKRNYHDSSSISEEERFRLLISSLQNVPLDFNKPLWEVVVIRNYPKAYALLFRVHHCIGDGSSLGVLFAKCCDNPPDFQKIEQEMKEKKKQLDDKKKNKVMKNIESILVKIVTFVCLCGVILWRPFLKGFSKQFVFVCWVAMGSIFVLWKWFKEVLDVSQFHSQYGKGMYLFKWLQNFTLQELFDALKGKKILEKVPTKTGENVISPITDRTILLKSKKMGTKKRIAWFSDMHINDIRLIGKLTKKATINDVMLACISGALNRYMNKTEKWAPLLEKYSSMKIRIGIPVNVRNSMVITEPGNKFGFMVTSLPIGNDFKKREKMTKSKYMIRRLAQIKRTMDWNKFIPEPQVAYIISQMSSLMPRDIVKRTFSYLTKGYLSAVVTNVRGSDEELTINGKSILDIIGFVPPPPSVPLGAMIVSYNHTVTVSFSIDSLFIPDPENLIGELKNEYEELLDLAKKKFRKEE